MPSSRRVRTSWATSTAAPRRCRTPDIERVIDTDMAIEIVHCGNGRAAIHAIRTATGASSRSDRLAGLRRVIIGNDAPSGTGVVPLGILRVIAHLASLGGVAPELAIAMATGNTARVHGLDVGMLAPGRAADVVLCDAPVGSSASTALEALAIGDLPGDLDGPDRRRRQIGRSRNTPPAGARRRGRGRRRSRRGRSLMPARLAPALGFAGCPRFRLKRTRWRESPGLAALDGARRAVMASLPGLDSRGLRSGAWSADAIAGGGAAATGPRATEPPRVFVSFGNRLPSPPERQLFSDESVESPNDGNAGPTRGFLAHQLRAPAAELRPGREDGDAPGDGRVPAPGGGPGLRDRDAHRSPARRAAGLHESTWLEPITLLAAPLAASPGPSGSARSCWCCRSATPSRSRRSGGPSTSSRAGGRSSASGSAGTGRSSPRCASRSKSAAGG